jgi:hypothetical protein
MTDRKKPGWAFWATVVLLSSSVLYVLSFGPACWLSNDGMISSTTITTVYPGLWQVVMRGPQPFRRWLRWYVNLPKSWQGEADPLKEPLDAPSNCVLSCHTVQHRRRQDAPRAHSSRP